jgi:lipopolysaccharide biosynthesis glycosyltransferase
MLSAVQIVEQNRPARYNKAVFLGVDERFHPYALFVADQIVRRCPERDFDVCILCHAPLSYHPLWEQHELRVCRLETAGFSNRVRSTEDITFASYLRLFAPSMLEKDYRRLLYLDADVFYQRGDLSKLLDLEIGPHPLGAVRDMSQLRRPKRRHKDFKTMGLGYSKYFNSGFLLIDVPQYLSEGIGERAMDFAVRYAGKTQTNDQSILNAAVFNHWAELSLVWNFQYSTQTLYFSSMFDVCFFHFVGRRKPFLRKGGIFPRRITEPYRRFMAEHFPMTEHLTQDGLMIEKNRWLHFRALLFHLTSFRRFLRNEASWRTDWDVR